MRWVLILAVMALAAAGCTVDPTPEPDGPRAGDTWVLEGADRAGVFGEITVTRGDVITLPPEANAGAMVPGASHGVLVHVRYEHDRANDSGIGAFDWGGRTGGDGEGADGRFRMGALVSNVDWPVGPFLGTLLPDNDQSLEGWFYIAATPQDLDGPIFLQYQPLLVPTGGGFGPELVDEILIYAP